MASASRERPDVVLLDVKLGATSGYHVCRGLRDQFGEQLPIIFLSGTRTDATDRVAGLLLGADDYLTKPVHPDELLARVGRAMSRSASSEQETPKGAEGGLTPREGEVLRLLAQGLGTAAISERLFIRRKTVGTHVQRILAKVGLHSRAEAVAFAYRQGMVEDVSAHDLALSRL